MSVLLHMNEPLWAQQVNDNARTIVDQLSMAEWINIAAHMLNTVTLCHSNSYFIPAAILLCCVEKASAQKLQPNVWRFSDRRSIEQQLE